MTQEGQSSFIQLAQKQLQNTVSEIAKINTTDDGEMKYQEILSNIYALIERGQSNHLLNLITDNFEISKRDGSVSIRNKHEGIKYLFTMIVNKQEFYELTIPTMGFKTPLHARAKAIEMCNSGLKYTPEYIKALSADITFGVTMLLGGKRYIIAGYPAQDANTKALHLVHELNTYNLRGYSAGLLTEEIEVKGKVYTVIAHRAEDVKW